MAKSPPYPLRVALIYLVCGVLWIVSTDSLLNWLVDDPRTTMLVATYKGWFFVLASAGLLYFFIGREYSNRRRVERTRVISEERYRSLFENMLNGFVYCQLIYKGDQLQDFVFLEANDAVEKLTGLGDLVGRKASEVFPGIQEADPGLFEIVSRVASSGKPEIFEGYLDALGMWMSVSAYSPEREHFAAVFDAITERKQAEEQLRRSEAALKQAQRVAQVGSWTWYIQSNHLEWSDEMYHLFGIDKDGFTGELSEVIERAIHPDDRAAVERSNRSVVEEGKPVPMEYRVIRPDGTVRVLWAEAGELLLDAAGKSEVLTGIVQDITERKQMVEALRESEERYRRLAENAPDIIYRYELAPRLHCTYINPAAEAITGYTPEEHYADPELGVKLVHPDDREHLQDFERLFAGPIVLRWIRKDGKTIWTEQRNVPIYDEAGNLVALEGIARDITARQQAEEALHESRQRYNYLFERIVSGVAVYEAREDGSDFIFKELNPAGERLSQVKRDEIVGRSLLDVFPSVKEMGLFDVFQRVWKSGAAEHQPVSLYQDGRVSEWVENDVYKLPSGEIVAVYNDVTARRQAEEDLHASEERYRTLAEAAQDFIFIIDRDDCVEYVNTFGANHLGLRPEDLIGKPRATVFPSADGKRQKGNLRRVFETGEPLEVESRTHFPGRQIWLQTVLAPIRDQQGQVRSVLGISRDTSARRQAEERMRAALEEKEVLLREVHHRVKNNLQAMIYLVDMQAVQIKNQATRRFLRELQEQARTMSLVYELLYQSENLAQVAMQPYLQQIAGGVLQAFAGERPIHLDLKLAPVSLDVSYAMPCGLIVNELITNAVKYAFPASFSDKPAVRVSLRAKGEHCTLTVSDNGVGLPPGQDWQKSKSLGLRLVNLWATHQLGGSLDVTSRDGATYTITFRTGERTKREG